MSFKSLFLLFAAAVAVNAVPIAARDEATVYTATRVYHTTTDVYPYLIDATTIITWTAGPTTTVALPTGPGL